MTIATNAYITCNYKCCCFSSNTYNCQS